MKYYIIAGEASGDLHGSNLIREIRKLDQSADIRCWGGDLMEAAGAVLVRHYRDLAFMGFVEVVANLPTILSNLRLCKKDIQGFAPDVVIFIDYPGFNIPIAQFAKKKGYRTVYYISPQVWAWKENRVQTLRKVIDKMLVILPFEKAFYKKWNYEVEYVGHPLVETCAKAKGSRLNNESTHFAGKRLIALLPGSRKQEIATKLPVMLEVSRFFPDCRFIVAQAPSMDDDLIQMHTAPFPNVGVVKGQTYELLASADAALVTSGTATLETALFGVPELVCYKGNPLSYAIARRVIKVKYISLVNLIMDKPVVKELIQDELTPQNIRQELENLLYDESYIRTMKSEFQALTARLSAGGSASYNAAHSIVTWLEKENI